MSAGSNNKKNRGSGKSSIDKKIEKLKKPGKKYSKAQILALRRKAMGKTIAQVKAENEKKMRDRARERNEKFKKNQKLKIKKNNKSTNNKSVNQKIEDQKEKNKKIIKRKNFLSNIK